MLERQVHPRKYFRCGFKKCLRSWFLDLLNVLAEVLDNLVKFGPDVRRAFLRII